MSLGDKTYPEGDSWWEREEKDGCSAHRGRLNGILASFSRTSEDESNSSHHLILSLQPVLQAPSTAAAFVGCGLPWVCHFNLSPTPPSSPRPFTLLHVYPRFLTCHTTTTLRTFVFSSFLRMDSADAHEHQPPMDSLDWQAYRNLSLQPHGFGDERIRIWSVLLVLQHYVYEHAIGPNLSLWTTKPCFLSTLTPWSHLYGLMPVSTSETQRRRSWMETPTPTSVRLDSTPTAASSCTQ